jgi:hypothetical protein
MFVSHLSYFLFYLYVSASVQCKNCLARDKSYLAIPTMRWFNQKMWFVLRHAAKHRRTLAANDGNACHWGRHGSDGRWRAATAGGNVGRQRRWRQWQGTAMVGGGQQAAAAEGGRGQHQGLLGMIIFLFYTVNSGA